MKSKDLLEDHQLAIFLSFVVAGILTLFILIYVSSGNDKIPERDIQPETKPSIYITRTDRVLTFEGETVWILEYTVDGQLEAPAFTSQEAMTEYREYLDTIGKVYQKEEEGHGE